MKSSSTPHPIGKDELRSKLIEMQKEMLDNAKPMQELTIRAIEEDWDDEKLQSEVLTLIKNKLLDLRKDYAYYADKVIELFDAYTIEAEKRAAKDAIIRAKVAHIDSKSKAEFDQWCSDEMERIYPTLEEVDNNAKRRS